VDKSANFSHTNAVGDEVCSNTAANWTEKIGCLYQLDFSLQSHLLLFIFEKLLSCSLSSFPSNSLSRMREAERLNAKKQQTVEAAPSLERKPRAPSESAKTILVRLLFPFCIFFSCFLKSCSFRSHPMLPSADST
jgi:hypothetical protein